VALVTGGIRGIGAAICDRLAARGMTIAAGYSRDKEAADLFRETHPGSSVHQGDIGAVEDCERVISEVLNQHGRLDVLVNNAGNGNGGVRAWMADAGAMRGALWGARAEVLAYEPSYRWISGMGVVLFDRATV